MNPNIPTPMGAWAPVETNRILGWKYEKYDAHQVLKYANKSVVANAQKSRATTYNQNHSLSKSREGMANWEFGTNFTKNAIEMGMVYELIRLGSATIVAAARLKDGDFTLKPVAFRPHKQSLPPRPTLSC
ncbi:hypothetical protein HOY80DRAFT_1001243 [Tuber brumale]|nr:hypothetical protein HOY80DRAFT_1001243 [Tuber brumale]